MSDEGGIVQAQIDVFTDTIRHLKRADRWRFPRRNKEAIRFLKTARASLRAQQSGRAE